MCDMTGFVSPRSRFAIVFLCLCFLTAGPGYARDPENNSRTASPISLAAPAYCMAVHNVGRIGFSVSNFGRFSYGQDLPIIDCLTLQKALQAEYPIGSRTQYMYRGGMWIGGVIGRDTLVSTAVDLNSTAREFHPDELPFGSIKRFSTLSEVNPEEAVSEQDFIAVYTDTFTVGVDYRSFDPIAGRGHEPLGIEVTQRSYVWSYGYADDFVLFDMTYRNIGDKDINDLYIGVYLDADVNVSGVNPNAAIMGSNKPTTGGDDDLSGFLKTFPRPNDESCPFEDTLNIAYISDNDGDPSGVDFVLPNITGIKFLRELGPNQKLTYNWWVWNPDPNYDFGPQTRDQFRYMGRGLGTPVGDVNKYHLLSNGEIDYDQIFALEKSSGDATFTPSNSRHAGSLSQGADVHYLLSYGPYDLRAGQQFDLPMVYVGGEGYHTDKRNVLWNLRNAYRPKNYLKQVHFNQIAQNSVWASWVYDNPGVDTDGDGNFGAFYVCQLDSGIAETTFYKGDGVPDFRSATPPPPPKVWVTPIEGGLHIRWNGQASETSRDIFSGLLDFEGYRVYYARDDREGSYSMTASYDRENYDKLIFNPYLKPEPGYELSGPPLSVEEIRCLYSRSEDPCSDLTFDPFSYSASVPYVLSGFPDSAFYFRPHDYNTSAFGVSTGIRRAYPNAQLPTGPPTEADLTPEGYLKYYEYEFDITGLLSTVGYYANVTAFDFGSPEADLQPLETSRRFNAHFVYPTLAGSEPNHGEPKAFIFPNPYRDDDGYRKKGFEGRDDPFAIPDRVRKINFANLPPKCTIRIHSIDGDLIREIDHNFDPDDPNASRDEWDMISRNVQMIVSGIYFWSVEDKLTGKTQIGKLIVIM